MSEQRKPSSTVLIVLLVVAIGSVFYSSIQSSTVSGQDAVATNYNAAEHAVENKAEQEEQQKQNSARLFWDTERVTEAFHFVKKAGNKIFPYGFELHYVTGTLSGDASHEVDPDDPYIITLVAPCDVTNAFNSTAHGLTCVARVKYTRDGILTGTIELLSMSIDGETVYESD